MYALDIDFHESVERLADYRGMPGRTRIIEGIKRTTLLDDSYNSSPLAAYSAMHDLVRYPCGEGKKRIAALGDMLELGALAEGAHRDLGRIVAELGIDMLVGVVHSRTQFPTAQKQAACRKNRFSFFQPA